MNTNTKQGDLVHQITAILVKNKAKITPETTWVNDLRGLINQEVTAVLSELEGHTGGLQTYKLSPQSEDKLVEQADVIKAIQSIKEKYL